MSMIFRLIIPFLIAIVLSTSSCVNNSEEDLYGLECDTLNMTYAKIKYIFEDNCYICHTVTQGTYNIKLNSYSEVKAAVNKGRLVGAINQLNGFKPMPNGQPQLSDCLIDRIEAWINAGMPE